MICAPRAWRGTQCATRSQQSIPETSCLWHIAAADFLSLPLYVPTFTSPCAHPQEFFNGKELCKSIDPDEAVAYGAAVQVGE